MRGEAGPQEITVHGRPVAVVLSGADYDRVVEAGGSPPDFMRRAHLHVAHQRAIERPCWSIPIHRQPQPPLDLAAQRRGLDHFDTLAVSQDVHHQFVRL